MKGSTVADCWKDSEGSLLLLILLELRGVLVIEVLRVLLFLLPPVLVLLLSVFVVFLLGSGSGWLVLFVEELVFVGKAVF